MSMYDAIKNFPSQFDYQPEIKNSEKLIKKEYFIVCGMGGSHLAADLLKIVKPEIGIFINKNYGLPKLPKDILEKSLIIASSYSGNTEETLSSYQEAIKNNLPLAVITTSGKLLEWAIRDSVPYIQMPETGIQPRSALGFSMKAMLALIGTQEDLNEISKLSQILKPENFETEGKELAQKISSHVPVIYSSAENEAIAYNWKIKFNETGKIPAFYNVFSELNHNEMTGFDVKEKTKNLSDKFIFLILKDEAGDSRVQKRMEILKKLYEDRGLPVIEIKLSGKSVFEKIFSSIILADWIAYYTAESYYVDSEQVPMVEEFKKLVS